MLRFVRGGSQRSIVSAVVATAATALTVSACTGSSSSGSRSTPPPVPSSSAASEAPDTTAQDATADLRGSATITLGSSAPVTVRTSKQQPATLELTPSGAASLDLSMRNSAGDLFSISGPARTGASITTDVVAVLLLSTGAIVDTSGGNPCSATYDVVSETAVRGTVRCQTLSGQQKVAVIVRFSAS